MWGAAILLGFFGSLHCLGMCGPIAFMLPLNHKHAATKLGQLVLYHLGRLLSYSVLGGMFGLLGKGLYIFGLQQKLSIFAGVVMILLVLLPSQFLQKHNIAKWSYKVLVKVKSMLGAALQKKTADTFLTIGFLNGFLPCGLVYIALIGAMGFGNSIQGAGYMAFFGLGTIPLMSAVVYLGGALKKTTNIGIRKFIPAIVLFVGMLFILRGMGLGIPYVSPKLTTTNLVTAEVECHQP